MISVKRKKTKASYLRIRWAQTSSTGTLLKDAGRPEKVFLWGILPRQPPFSVTHPSSPFPPQPKELRSSYCLHSPERRGSPLVAAACPPPAGHSWCHTSRSDSPGAEDKVRVTSLGPPDRQPLPGFLVRSGHLPPLGCAVPSPRTLPVQSCCCLSGLGVEHRKHNQG